MTCFSIYPTGETMDDLEKCLNGYTFFQAKEALALLPLVLLAFIS